MSKAWKVLLAVVTAVPALLWVTSRFDSMFKGVQNMFKDGTMKDPVQEAAKTALSAAEKAKAARKAAGKKNAGDDKLPPGKSPNKFWFVIPGVMASVAFGVWWFFFGRKKNAGNTDYYQGLLGLSDADVAGKSKAYLAGVAKRQRQEQIAPNDTETGKQLAGLKAKTATVIYGQVYEGRSGGYGYSGGNSTAWWNKG